MSLADLIRGKSISAKFATATPATVATSESEKGRTVASIATVAVANPLRSKTELPQKVGQQAPTSFSCWWRIHSPDHHPVEVAFCPEVTQAEVLKWYPDATKAESFVPVVQPPSTPMTAGEEVAVRKWLELIQEIDPATIAQVLEQCRKDQEAKLYFLKRAGEIHGDR